MNSDQLSEKEWEEKLSNEEYCILRKKGTERPFSGKYNDFYEEGVYHCTGCDSTLFTSEQKFKSGCGWPSFDQAIPNVIEETPDFSHGMIRTEITCKNCGGHLGHVFNDGPTETGVRYCVNSVSLDFREKK